MRRCTVAIIAAAMLVGSLLGAASAYAAPKGPKELDRKRVIERAYTWTRQGVPYSQTRYKGGYRTDCSGFVSMAWDLPENLVTFNIPLVAERIGKSELKAGDILLNTGAGRHAVIFEKWADDGKTAYVGLEQNGETNDAVRRVLPYPYKSRESQYKPYRYKGMDGFYKAMGDDLQPVKGWDERKAKEAAVKAEAEAKAKAAAAAAAAEATEQAPTEGDANAKPAVSPLEAAAERAFAAGSGAAALAAPAPAAGSETTGLLGGLLKMLGA